MAITNPDNSIVPPVIDSSSLNNNATPITPVFPVYNATQQGADQAGAYTNSSYLQAEQQAKQAEELARTTLTGQNSDLARLQSSIGGKGQDTLNAYNTADSTGNSVNTLAGRLRGLSAQSQALGYKAQIIPSEIQNKVANTGATDRGIAPIQSQQLRDNLIQQASIAMESAIAKADYDTAKSFADQIIDAKYDQKLADIDAARTNIDNIKSNLTSAEKKLAEATTARLNKEEKDYQEKKANDKGISDILINASSQNAPAQLLAKAKLAKSPSEAAMILGQYAGDYYKTELLKNQIQTEKAQRAKIYADTAKISADLRAVNSANISSEAASWVANINSGKAKISDVPAKLKTEVSLGLSASTSLTTEQKAKIEASQSTYDLANELLTLSGKGGAVGAGFGKAFGAVIPGYDGTAFSGTDRANYEAKVAQLKDTLASANLDKLKGAMSDKDIEFLRNIGTALKPSMSETAFDSELNKIKTTMSKIPGVVPAQHPKAYNPFTQALGQSSQVIPGTSIVNDVSSSGDIIFTIPK